MTRFFGGYGGSGSNHSRFGSSGSSKTSNANSSYERAVASKDRMKQLKKGGNQQQSSEERYQKLVQEKMERSKAALMAEKKFSSNMHLPGTKPQEKELSKSTQMALEMIAQKMAKKEMAAKKKNEGSDVKIKPTHISGMYTGYLDAKGRLLNNQGQVVLKVKNGFMYTQGLFGKKIGKYDPKSHACYLKLAKQLEKDAHKRGVGNPAASLYGTTTTNDTGGGSMWGTPGAGSIWGNTDDNNGSGW